MALDKLAIANKALGKLGSQAITSFAQSGSNEATAINNVYDDILDEVLSEHPWSFAQKRVALSVVVADDVSRSIDEPVFSPITITGATADDPVVITANNHGLQNGDEIVIQGVSGMTQLNGNTYYVADKTNDTFSLEDEDGDTIDGDAYSAYTSGGQIFKATAGTPIIITAATAANPVVITAAAHGLSDGDWIKIVGVAGMTNLNGNFYIVDDATTNTFSLDDTDGENVNGSAYSAYTYGGRVYEAIDLPATDFDTIVVYQKPTDLVKVNKKSDPNARLHIEQDKIISSVENLKIKYTYRNVTVSQYPPKFVNALATRLAAEICFTVTNSTTKVEGLMKIYNDIDLPQAMAVDSTEGTPDEAVQDEWLDAMRTGGQRVATVGDTWHPV